MPGDVGLIAIGGVLAAALNFVLVLWLPGYLVSRLFVPEAESTERFAISQVCSFTVVPLGYLLVAVAAGIPLDRQLLWVLAFALSAATATFIHQRSKSGQHPPLHRWTIGVSDIVRHLTLALACTVLVAFGLRALDGGDVFSTLQHCLYVIVMHTVANDPSTALPLYDHLSGETVYVLVNHTRDAFNGLAPLFHEQRLGNAAIMAPHVALMGSAGWYSVVVHASVVTALCSFVTARRLGASTGVSAVSSGLLLLATHNLCAYTVNENMFAVAIVSFLLWFALRTDLGWSHVVLVGLVLGHLVGVRHTSSLFWPGTLLALAWSPGGTRKAVLAFVCSLLTVSPWLYVNYLMLGNPLSHPKVIDDSDGRVVQNTILGFQFTFKAMNYPFTQQLVRTAWHPFPTLIWLPLMMAWSFGQLAFATAWFGLRQALRHRRTGVVLLAFALPHNLAIGWLELLDWEQISYAAPGFVPIGAFLALGLQRLTARTPRDLVAWGAVVAVIMLGSYGLRALELPVDMRGLSAADWPEEPALDRGAKAVRDELTRFRPIPRIPVFRSIVYEQLMGSLDAMNAEDSVPVAGGLPLYPSGRLGILTGYAETAPREYRFGLTGRAPRAPETPVRTGVSLHTVAVRVNAERLEVTVVRDKGRYTVNLVSAGDSGTPRDFTFWINPWRPWAKSIDVTLNGEPLPSLRVLKYGGNEADGEALLLATNYPADVVNTRRITLTVDTADETTHCGWLIFGHPNHDMTRIETLVLAGGHVLFWHGEKTLSLTLPNHILAQELILFSEPYCSSHVPQYGDRYGRVTVGPDDKSLEVRLDQLWMP